MPLRSKPDLWQVTTLASALFVFLCKKCAEQITFSRSVATRVVLKQVMTSKEGGTYVQRKCVRVPSVILQDLFQSTLRQIKGLQRRQHMQASSRQHRPASLSSTNDQKSMASSTLLLRYVALLGL